MPRIETLKAEIGSLRGPIVVFGACGFIGANLYRRIYEVRKDCFAITHQDYIPWRLIDMPRENILHCDITDDVAVSELVARYGFQTCFCFSAFGAYSRQTNPVRIYNTNLMGLIYLATAMESYGFSAFVHAGSSSEYGLNCTAPQEESVLQPNSHYAVSKAATSQLIRYLGEQRGLPIIHLRYYSVYGPWEESDRLIPRLIESGLHGQFPPMVSPETTRDFVYVDDATGAAILSAVKGVRTAAGASLNIASGNKTTLGELIRIVKELFGVPDEPQWSTMTNREWDTKNWYGDPSNAKKILGWSTTTEIRQGLLMTAEWVKRSGETPRTIIASVDNQAPVRLSVVVACYMDDQAITVIHDRLTKVFRDLGVDYEIIFVNDASPDDTSEVLSRLCKRDPHVIAVEHTRNFGSQSAFLSGMEISSGHAVIIMDGDLQDPPELILKFFAKWREGFDVVYGVRAQRKASPVMRFCYKGFYRLFRWLAYVSIPLDAGDFSLMDRKVVKELTELPETNQFLRGLRAWVGFKQIGVDYVRDERMFGVTTNNWLKNFWWARKAIFNFSFMPLEWLLCTGFFLTILSGMGFVGQIFYRLSHPELPHGITTIILLTLFFGGANMLAISVLGEYVSKVFEETKRRPKFIRHSVRIGDYEMHQSDKVNRFVELRKRTLLQAMGRMCHI